MIFMIESLMFNMLDLVFKNQTRVKSPGENFFKKFLSAGIKELRIKDKKIEISVNLVGDNRIKELNKNYLGKNKVTDVLSFPLDEARFKKHGILPLGDIFICLPFAVQEAKKQNISLETELARLTVHGFLHLLGYEHKRSAKDAKEMSCLENKILNKR